MKVVGSKETGYRLVSSFAEDKPKKPAKINDKEGPKKGGKDE